MDRVADSIMKQLKDEGYRIYWDRNLLSISDIRQDVFVFDKFGVTINHNVSLEYKIIDLIWRLHNKWLDNYG